MAEVPRDASRVFIAAVLSTLVAEVTLEIMVFSVVDFEAVRDEVPAVVVLRVVAAGTA